MLIRTNGKVEPISVDGLSDMQSAVGGNIEYALTGGDDITLNGVKQTWDLIGNEEGRLRELPLNPIAREFIAEMCDILHSGENFLFSSSDKMLFNAAIDV